MELSAHPVHFVHDLANRYGDELSLSFSRYFYRPQSAFDERVIFSVQIADVTAEWLNAKVASLLPGWELALNSLVVDGRNRKFHIPMIDFLSVDFSSVVRSSLVEIIGRPVTREMVFYDSGRSFHAYSGVLLKQKEWYAFMGKLLLLNLPDTDEVVDSRWIGHRLVGGFAALRWSANTSFYRKAPSHKHFYL